MSHLDNTDISLLKFLQNDAKLSVKELAQKVNLSATPVYERIKKLEKEGFIKKYIAVLDKEKLDKGLIVFCNVSLIQHTKDIGAQFIKDIMMLNEVTECYNISGDYDFMLKILVNDMKHYQDFIVTNLGAIKNIGSVHSRFVIGEIKNSYSVPL